MTARLSIIMTLVIGFATAIPASALARLTSAEEANSKYGGCGPIFYWLENQDNPDTFSTLSLYLHKQPRPEEAFPMDFQTLQAQIDQLDQGGTYQGKPVTRNQRMINFTKNLINETARSKCQFYNWLQSNLANLRACETAQPAKANQPNQKPETRPAGLAR